MQATRLRVYYGPESAPAALADHDVDVDSVTVPLGHILPLMLEAVRSERTWLEDFEGDEVTLSRDLYEVILAYQHCRRPSA
ncbi:MAG: hypothetical protein R3C10_01305 [Pirellulales bacterium]|nr:hypothetical protein [Planctomycetales bacterium]